MIVTQKPVTTSSREFRRFLLVAQLEAKEIGKRIAQARLEAGLTQEQLAEMAPFSYRSLQDYEQGVTIPYRQLREISKLLDRPVEWFLHGEKEEELELLERLVVIEQLLEGLDRKFDVDRQAIEQRLVGLQEQLGDALRARLEA